MESLDSLIKQANRLRFSDPNVERRYWSEKVNGTLTKTRVLFIVAVLVVGGLGVQESNMLAAKLPEFVQVSLSIRFFCVIPLYALFFFSTLIPGHSQRVDTVFGFGITAVTWALALIKWHAVGFFEWQNVSAVLLLDILTTVLISVLALPMHFRTVVLLSAASIGGIVWFYSATTLAGAPRLQLQLSVSFVAFGAFAVVLQGFRERSDRRGFAQREHTARLNTELERLNQEKNEFMMIAAHDLRSPLAVIKAYAEMLQTTRTTPDEASNAHASITEQADCMLELVNNYLGAHAIETGTVRIESRRLNLWAVARKLQRTFGPRAAVKSQSVSIVSGKEPVWVDADPGLLAQVVENFLSNALKFSPTGTEIRLAVSRVGDNLKGRIAVSDNGPGIPKGEQGNVFRKFARTSVRPTGGETSHGLGLALVKVVAERLNASVDFHSIEHAGSTFWIDLPLAEQETK